MANRVRTLRIEALENRRMLSLTALSGNLLADEVVEGDQTTFSQSRAPTVAMDADGDAVAVWIGPAASGYGTGVFAKRFDGAGEPQGDTIAVSDAGWYERTLPSVAMDDDGDFVVTWSNFERDGSLYGVYARCYNALGEPRSAEFRVNQVTVGNQDFSAVAMDADGDFVIAWTSADQDGDRTGIFARCYDATGAPASDEFQVNTTTAGNQRYPTVAMDAVGDFLITWTSQDQDGSGGGIYAQYYGVDGMPRGDEFPVNTTTAGNQQFSSVTMDSSGAVVVWQGYDASRATWDVYVQQFDLDGAPSGEELRVAEGRAASVAQGIGGEFVLAWETYDPTQSFPVEIQAAHFDYLGLSDGVSVEIGGAEGEPFGAAVATNGQTAMLAWTNDTLGANGLDVGARLFEATAIGARNHAPVIDPIDAVIVDEAETVIVTVTATDPDDPNAALLFSLAPGAPEGAQIDAATGEFRWTPSELQGPGSYAIGIRATDDGTPAQTGVAILAVTVNEVNQPPVFDPPQIGNPTITAGEALSLVITATDPDVPASELVFSLDNGPGGATIDPATGELYWATDSDQTPDSYPVRVRVTDSPAAPAEPLSATMDFSIVVVASPPLGASDGTTFSLAPMLARAVTEEDTLQFTPMLRGDVAPESTLEFSLDAGKATGASIDSTTGVVSWTPIEGQGGRRYEITIHATDRDHPEFTAFVTMLIRVDVLNRAPVIAAISDQTVLQGETLLVQADAMDTNNPPDRLRHGLQTGAPEGMAIDRDTGLLSWTPGPDVAPGDYPVTVWVLDYGWPRLDAATSFTVHVAATAAMEPASAPVSQASAELSDVALTDWDPLSDGAAISSAGALYWGWESQRSQEARDRLATAAAVESFLVELSGV